MIRWRISKQIWWKTEHKNVSFSAKNILLTTPLWVHQDLDQPWLLTLSLQQAIESTSASKTCFARLMQSLSCCLCTSSPDQHALILFTWHVCYYMLLCRETYHSSHSLQAFWCKIRSISNKTSTFKSQVTCNLQLAPCGHLVIRPWQEGVDFLNLQPRLCWFVKKMTTWLVAKPFHMTYEFKWVLQVILVGNIPNDDALEEKGLVNLFL